MHYVFVEVTNKCTIACRYCFYRTGYLRHDNKQPLTPEKMISLLGSLKPESVILTGGDPFHPEVLGSSLALVARLKSRGVFTAVDTALVVDDDRHLEQIARSGIDTIYVSCDSHQPHIHDSLRGKWEITVGAIKNLLDSGRQIVVNCTLTSLNCSTLRETWRFFKSLGTADVDFSIAYLPKGIPLYAELSCAAMPYPKKQQLIKDLEWWSSQHTTDTRAHFVHHQISLFLKSSRPLPRLQSCAMGSEVLVVNRQGKIKPCFHRPEIWASADNLSGLKEKIRSAKTTPFSCVGCHCASLFAIDAFWAKPEVS